MRWWCLRFFFLPPERLGCAGYAFVSVSSLFGQGIQAWGLKKKKSHDATVRVFLSRVRNLVAVVVEVVAARGQNAGARPATESTIIVSSC